MLEQMRTASGSWIARILMLLLMVSFGIWGIGDYLRPKPDTTAAKVGDEIISDQVYQAEVRKELRNIQMRAGFAVTPEMARQFGIYDRIIDQLVTYALFDQEGQRLKLGITDPALAEIVRNIPAFRNQLGQFDPTMFRAVLANQGQSEGQFLADLRREMIRAQLAVAIMDAIYVAPTAMVEQIYRYREERRSARYFAVPDAALPKVPDPTEAELTEFYNTNLALFTAPELRSVSVAQLSPEAVAKTINVTDQEIADEYEARKAQFTVPAKRTIDQLVYQNDADAKAAYDQIKGGADFIKVGEDTLKQTAADFALGSVTEADLPPQLGVPAFALALNAVSEPIQTPFGWHILRVTKIEPGSVRSLDQVKDELRREIALRMATDRIVKLAQQADDKLAGGASLEDTAQALGFNLIKLNGFDQRGADINGKPVAALPPAADFLDSTFRLPERNDLQVTELRDGALYIIRVDTVEPAHPRPLDEVKAQVAEAWATQQRAKAAETFARAAADKINGGADPAKIADEMKAAIETSPALTRAGNPPPGARTANPFFAQTLAALFAAPVNGAVAGPAADGRTWLVATLTDIQEPKFDPKDAAPKEMSRTIANAQAQDLLEAYRNILEKRFPVDLHRKVIESLQ